MQAIPSSLIIGAAGGIGTELCRRLTQQGQRVWMVGRDAEKLSRLATELGQRYTAADATDWGEIEKVVEQAAEEFGGLTGACNLAGSVLLKPAHLTSQEELRNVLDQNLMTAFGLVRSVAPLMKKNGGGSIVLMSSAGASIGLMSHEAIAAAKGGIAAMARAAAVTYGAGGVRINTVAPGLVKTGLTTRIWQNERAAEASTAMHPLGRLGEPADIASLIAWLLHPEQTWITGQEIAVDGGLSTLKTASRS